MEELYLPVEQIKFDSGPGVPPTAETAQDLENDLACSEVRVVHAQVEIHRALAAEAIGSDLGRRAHRSI